MYKQQIEEDLKRVIRDLGFVLTTDIVLSIPENTNFGDYSSNISLQLAKQNSKNSKQTSLEIASEILKAFSHPQYLERIDIAGPGFLNFYLKDEALVKVIYSSSDSEKSSSRLRSSNNKNLKKYLVEFAHPNTHKAFHIGHLRTLSIGESLSRLLEFQGYEVFRANYGGDIGPHVAKAIWAVKKLKAEFEKVRKSSLQVKGEFLGKAYAIGSKSYESDPKIKQEIDEINKRLYDGDPKLKPLWEETKNWSIAYFESIYSRLGTEFDVQIWESEIQERGKKIVEENLNRVFFEDDGAIIFPGEKFGLHNRVFITSKGHPTYEGKELGLTEKERELFPYDFSIHVVDVQQTSFFEVTTKALEQIDQAILGKKKHLPFGFVNLATGKMSSREGNVITSDELIYQVKEKLKENIKSKLDDFSLDKIAIAAIKFTYLKYALISEISFDIEKSVSLNGDSGPYLLYTYARINSLVNRAKDNLTKSGVDSSISGKDKKANEAAKDRIAQGFLTLTPTLSQREREKEGGHSQGGNIADSLSPAEKARVRDIEDEERQILRQLEYFEGVAKKAASEFKPNEVANYLLVLAKTFNLYYEKYSILGSEKQDFRLKLVAKVGETTKVGLYLLGIEAVERM